LAFPYEWPLSDLPSSRRRRVSADAFSWWRTRRARRRHHVQRIRYVNSAHHPRNAPGPSGSVLLHWPATARVTLPTIDRTHLRWHKALPISSTRLSLSTPP